MNPNVLIENARAEGVSLAATDSGTIKVAGRGEIVRRWQPMLREHKADVLAVLLQAANDLRSRRWRVVYPGAIAIEVICYPDATRADLSALYPGAQARPLPEHPRRAPTPAEVAEIQALVSAVAEHEGWAVDELHDAIAAALVDPEGALASYRFLAQGTAEGLEACSTAKATGRALLTPHGRLNG